MTILKTALYHILLFWRRIFIVVGWLIGFVLLIIGLICFSFGQTFYGVVAIIAAFICYLLRHYYRKIVIKLQPEESKS